MSLPSHLSGGQGATLAVHILNDTKEENWSARGNVVVGLARGGRIQEALDLYINPPTSLASQFPMFSFYLDDEPSSSRSELFLGGVNQKYYDGCLTWHALGHFVNEDKKPFEGFWDILITRVDAGEDNNVLSTSGVAVVDSGSTYIVMPTNDLKKVAAHYSSTCVKTNEARTALNVVDCDVDGGFDFALVDCADTELPNSSTSNLDFYIEGVKYSMTPQELYVHSSSPLPTEKQCFLGIMGSDKVGALYVLGDIFIRKYYTAFDLANKRVGFAPKTDERVGELCADDMEFLVNDPPGSGGSIKASVFFLTLAAFVVVAYCIVRGRSSWGGSCHNGTLEKASELSQLSSHLVPFQLMDDDNDDDHNDHNDDKNEKENEKENENESENESEGRREVEL